MDEEALLCLARGQRARAERLLEAYRKRLRETLGEAASPRVEALLKRLRG